MIDKETIKREMARQGKTQTQLGQLLGITQPNAGKLVNGPRKLSVEEAAKIAEWLKIEDAPRASVTLPSEPVAAAVVREVVKVAAPSQEVPDLVAEALGEALLDWFRRLVDHPRASDDPQEAREVWLDSMRSAFVRKLGPQAA